MSCTQYSTQTCLIVLHYALASLFCIFWAVWLSIYWVCYTGLVTEGAKNFMTCLNTPCLQNVGTFTPTAGGNITTTVSEKIKKGNVLFHPPILSEKSRFAYIKTMHIVARSAVLIAALMRIQVRWSVDEDSSTLTRWGRFKYVDALRKIQVR